jgi:hypothetical protein
MAIGSRRLQEESAHFGNTLPMFDPVGDDAEGQRFHLGNCIVLSNRLASRDGWNYARGGEFAVRER